MATLFQKIRRKSHTADRAVTRLTPAVPTRATVLLTARWAGLIAAGYLLGLLGRAVDIPAAHMMAGLLIGATLAMIGVIRNRLPRPAFHWVQMLVGVMIGSYLQLSALRSASASVLPLTVVSAATVALSVGVAIWVSRRGILDRPTATLSMVPGGSSSMPLAAEELGADVRIVAVGQYLRLALVAVITPFVGLALSTGPSTTPTTGSSFFSGLSRVVDNPNQVAGVATMLAIALLGHQFGRRAGLPSAAVLGPMLVSAAALAVGAVSGFAPKGVLQDVLFTVIGLEVGLRFTRKSVLELRRALPQLLLGSVLVSVGCGALAVVLAAATNMSLMDAYLATTPGGIYLVIPVALSLHANIALVSAVQSLRLFVAVLLAPPLVRWVLRSRQPAEPDTASSSPTARDARPTEPASESDTEQEERDVHEPALAGRPRG